MKEKNLLELCEKTLIRQQLLNVSQNIAKRKKKRKSVVLKKVKCLKK